MKIKGIYFLYRVLQAFGFPFLLFYFFWRGWQNRGYWNSLPQRFGFLPRTFRQTGPGAIWLHAVSVGEVLACLEFVRQLRQEFRNSGLFVSTSTIAGHQIAVQKLAGMADGVFYSPVDYVFAVRRVLRMIEPSVVVVAETEIWPNLFRETKRIHARLVIVNGRISDRAFPRYRRFAWFFRAVLPQADSILVQTKPIRDRFLALGAAAERTQLAGNFKYDFDPRVAPPESPVLAFLKRTQSPKVWIAASTMPPSAPDDVDEDDAVLAAFGEVARHHRNLLLIVAPRKPERFDIVVGKIAATGYPSQRRTSLDSESSLALPGILLLDTIGELSGLFGAADVVFMGGTLARRGGHNILEPALFGKAVITGPHMENFQSIAADFREQGASVDIGSASELAPAVARLLSNSSEARAIGQRALACAEARRGSTARSVRHVRELYDAGIPEHRPPIPLLAVRRLLSVLWRAGARRKRTHDLKFRRDLPVPVISIGNLTMGGTGKTPCVLAIAELLRAGGRRPGILTRGYGRGMLQHNLVLPPGASVAPEHSGDEPQIFIRSGIAPVGIGANRLETGGRLIRDFHVDTLLLDDGFQHSKLARDLDIVLVDALDPIGGGGVFPLGRLREPFANVSRAGVVVITRADVSDLVPAIERRIRVWNTIAPLFHASVEPRGWVEHRSGRELPLHQVRFDRAAAFCGLGNPQSFRRTIARLGIELVDWVEFEDHHRYRPAELKHLAHQFQASGATALLTTEKDAINLCESCDDLLAPLSLYWLKIGMAIERRTEFTAEILLRLEARRPK